MKNKTLKITIVLAPLILILIIFLMLLYPNIRHTFPIKINNNTPNSNEGNNNSIGDQNGYVIDNNTIDNNNLPLIKSSSQIPNKDGAIINIWIDSYGRLDVLRNNDMKYLFIDIGGTAQDGSINTSDTEIIAFLDYIYKYEEKNNYTFVLLAYSEVNTYNYNVTKEFRDNFVKTYAHMNELGFDGLLVDIEPVPVELRSEYMLILKDLRANLSKDAIISVYAGSINDLDSEWDWSTNFYQQVCNNSDIITVQGYDIGSDTEIDYKNYLKDQINRVATGNWNCKFMLGAPTHKNYPETLGVFLDSYVTTIKSYKNDSFIGISVFSEWTATENHWKIYETERKKQ